MSKTKLCTFLDIFLISLSVFVCFLYILIEMLFNNTTIVQVKGSTNVTGTPEKNGLLIVFALLKELKTTTLKKTRRSKAVLDQMLCLL